MASNMEVFIDGQKCIKVVNANGLDMIDENGNVVFVSKSGNLLLVYGKVDNIEQTRRQTPRPTTGCHDNNCGLPHFRNAVFHAAW